MRMMGILGRGVLVAYCHQDIPSAAALIFPLIFFFSFLPGCNGLSPDGKSRAAIAAADNKSESVDASSKRASETAVDEEVNLVELLSRRGSEHCFCDCRSCLADINALSFGELLLLRTQINAARDGWRLFLSTSASQEAAGEAIYSALLEGAPSLQSLFTSPRAVQVRIICTISRDPHKPDALSWRSVVAQGSFAQF